MAWKANLKTPGRACSLGRGSISNGAMVRSFGPKPRSETSDHKGSQRIPKLRERRITKAGFQPFANSFVALCVSFVTLCGPYIQPASVHSFTIFLKIAFVN